MSIPEIDADLPLCVSCEHALLKTNIFHEALFHFLRRKPLYVFLLPIWLLRGKAALIEQLAKSVDIDWRTVPLVERVREHIRAARSAHRQVFLLTSMPRTWGSALALELARCEAIFVGEASGEISAEDISLRLTGLFGARGFDYIGDGGRDLAVCKSARRALMVAADRARSARAGEHAPPEDVIRRDRTPPTAYLELIRLHQWVKNALVLVPLLAAHKLSSPQSLAIGMVAFLSFSFCASSVYVLNDLLDLESDRQHTRKRNRPTAAGKVTVAQALTIALLLLVVATWLAFRVSALFAVTLGVYFLMTTAYSLRLKRQVIVDVVLLAGLYTIRVVAGAVATNIVPSFWLLAFSMFLFLSLAIAKRYSEMLVTFAQNRQYAAGRGYSVADLPVLLSLGVSSGVAAVVVLALYINDPSTAKMYPATIWLWSVPPLILYWVSRIWMKAHRGEVHDDPVVFAMQDWQSLLTLALVGSSFVVAAISRP